MNQLRDGFNDSFIKKVAASEYASGGQKTVLVLKIHNLIILMLFLVFFIVFINNHNH